MFAALMLIGCGGPSNIQGDYTVVDYVGLDGKGGTIIFGCLGGFPNGGDPRASVGGTCKVEGNGEVTGGGPWGVNGWTCTGQVLPDGGPNVLLVGSLLCEVPLDI
jgi:hypothetical protein